MSLATNVVRRGSTFYFRVAVPQRLRATVARDELWRSLRTSHSTTARRRAAWLGHLTETLWRDLERLMQINIERVDRAVVQALIDQWLKAELDEDAYRREAPEDELFAGVVLRSEPAWKPDTVVRRISYDEVAEADDLIDPFGSLGHGEYLRKDVSDFSLSRDAQAKLFADAAERHRQEEESVAEEHVKALFVRHGIPVDEFSGKFETATLMMMKAHRDLWEAVQRRDVAGWRPRLDDDPAQRLIDGLTSVVAPVSVPADPEPPRSGKLLSIAAAEAISAIARKENFPPKRIEDYENAVRVFLDFLGSDPDFGQVQPIQVGAYMRALETYPSNASKRLPYRELSTFAEKLDAARAGAEKDFLSPVTINGKYLTPLRVIYAWYKEADPDLRNPLDGINAKKPKHADPNSARRDFSPTEVLRFLSLPLFTGSKGLAHSPLYLPGPKRVSDWRFWVPLICLFSGMRLNEACGLAVEDVRTSPDEVTYFHVRDEVEGQRLKTVTSRRRVPVHSSLVEIGFLRFVESMKAAGRVRLFEELEEDEDGYFSGKPSKFFQNLQPRYVDERPEELGKLSFHSTRHTVITKLRTAGVRQDIAKAVVGHEQGEVHGGYGTFELSAMRDAIEKVTYAELDLTNIRQPR